MEAQPSPAGSPGAITSTLGERKQDKARRTRPKGSTTDAQRRSVDGDFYKIAELVGGADLDLLRQVRAFAEEKIAPIINQHCGRAELPFELIRDYGTLGIAGAPYKGFGCLGRSTLLDGLIMMELARVDCSMATFHGVHSGLAYEGTREINTLVVGRAITGFGAFV